MKKKLPLLIKIIILIVFVYFFLFINYHLHTVDIGNLSINIDYTPNHIGTIQLSLKPTHPLQNYYILIYEDNFTDNWLYFTSNAYTKKSQHILEKLVPLHTNKYVFLEGDSTKSVHTFNIKSKYPINYITTQEHIFHAYLIVPYKLFLFLDFYYIKHQLFFINLGI